MRDRRPIVITAQLINQLGVKHDLGAVLQGGALGEFREEDVASSQLRRAAAQRAAVTGGEARTRRVVAQRYGRARSPAFDERRVVGSPALQARCHADKYCCGLARLADHGRWQRYSAIDA